jgi:hypothetical protein
MKDLLQMWSAVDRQGQQRHSAPLTQMILTGSTMGQSTEARDALNDLLIDRSWGSLLRNLPFQTSRAAAAPTTFDSVVWPMGSAHSETKSVIHWLSVKNIDNHDRGEMELLAIQSCTLPPEEIELDLVPTVRLHLARLLSTPTHQPHEELPSLMSSWWNAGQRQTAWWANRATTRDYLPRTSLPRRRLPLLEVLDEVSSQSHNRGENLNQPADNARTDSPWRPGDLKEIVIPVYASDVYGDERTTLFATLANRAVFRRPVPGVHQFLGSRVGLRPIPMAHHDRVAAPTPTLIFHSRDVSASCTDMQSRQDDQPFSATRNKTWKIGYNGSKASSQVSSGQLMVATECGGVDLRLCGATKPSSMFAEAQESLLAGSLDELQSPRVLSSSLSSSPVQSPGDEKQKDCWIEFRANVKNPQGFFARPHEIFGVGPKARIAQPPNLPYE